MISLGLWIIATGIVALSFECLGAALVLFGIAGLLIERVAAQFLGPISNGSSFAAIECPRVATARGGQWHAKSVSNILERA